MKQHGHSDKIALIGISPLFRKAVELARKVAATDASVFISGESGTGKEVIAQFIHQHSRRAGRAAGADQLRRPAGAAARVARCSATGRARSPAPTATSRACSRPPTAGTLFLDELTEMTLPLQAKLLRVIQDGVVRRVGQRDPGRRGRRPVHLGHQPRSAGSGRLGRPAGRPVLPAPGRARSSCPRCGSGPRTFRCWPTTS